MKRFLYLTISAFFLLSALFSPRVYATNYQDLWWNPAESGWGVNIAQQNDTLFATWFIYGANREPYWVVMPGTSRLPSQVPNEAIYTGAIFQTRGTPFNVTPFVPISDVTQVGSATFRFTNARDGVLTYNINSNTVTKNITRQNIVPLNLAGNYYGGFQRNTTGCTNNQNNGSALDQAIYIVSVAAPTTQTTSISINEVGGDSCRFTGAYTQFGSTFEGAGAYTCNGATGNWIAREGVSTESTISMKLNLTRTGETCTITGNIGGFKPN